MLITSGGAQDGTTALQLAQQRELADSVGEGSPKHAGRVTMTEMLLRAEHQSSLLALRTASSTDSAQFASAHDIAHAGESSPRSRR